MQLHLGKCIDDLDKLHNVPDLKSKRATVLCKTAQKLFEKAEEARAVGDEEYAYVYYMKYLRVVACLSQEKEYMKDKMYFTGMLGAKNPKRAIDMAETLKNSLIQRYDLERARGGKPLVVSPEEPPKAPADPKPGSPPMTIDHPLPALDEVTISCEQLFPLLKSGRLRVMLLDARPGHDFQLSHISHPHCISVPEECISPGQSAHVLEQLLPPSSRSVWAERANAELIVMLDWNSTTVIPAKPLFLLKTILLKWDVKVQYDRPPLCLWGGYEDWLLKYPQLTTGPTIVPPTTTQQSHANIAHLLDNIEYPSWEDEEEELPALLPALQAPPLRVSEPTVDRTSKAAAVRTYSERAQRMQQILEQQQRIADTSLTVELRRIEAEQDWERVREQSEAEQRAELRAAYRLREQEIISQLLQLENRQYDMEQENQSLRSQLEEYQRRERDGGAADVEALSLSSKRARIAVVEARREELDRRRGLLEQERQRRLKGSEGDEGTETPIQEETEVRRESPPPMPGTAPEYDRSSKPRLMPVDEAQRTRDRERHFEPIHGDDIGLGLTGLRNLGNTCYMNSILQCLANTVPLQSYLTSGHYRRDVDRNSPTGGAVVEELAALVSALWAGRYRHIGPKDFRIAVGRQQRAFRSHHQQDSHEFLTILMDCLQAELKGREATPRAESHGPAERAWQHFTGGRESLVLRLFYGQMRSTLRCQSCRHTSVTYEPFSNLSLELPAHASRCTLQECLRLYMSAERLSGWLCPSCARPRDATKTIALERLPPVLVIHFKRFYMTQSLDGKPSCEKKQTYIEFPLEGLSLPLATPSSPGSVAATPPYQLYAVSNHFGSTQSGHYTAVCRSKVYNRWFMYDDHAVSEVSEREVQSSAAYILFYCTTGRT